MRHIDNRCHSRHQEWCARLNQKDGQNAIPFPVGTPFGIDVDAISENGPLRQGIRLRISVSMRLFALRSVALRFLPSRYAINQAIRFNFR